MNDKDILIKAVPNFLNIKNFIFDGVHSATFGVIKKANGHPLLIHYESTNKRWSSFYSNSQEAKACHIVRASGELAKKSESFTLIWNLLIPDNEESQYINERRIELDHCNGVTICKNISDELLLCATFTGPQHDVNFAANFLKNKRLILKNTFDYKQVTVQNSHKK